MRSKVALAAAGVAAAAKATGYFASYSCVARQSYCRGAKKWLKLTAEMACACGCASAAG